MVSTKKKEFDICEYLDCGIEKTISLCNNLIDMVENGKDNTITKIECLHLISKVFKELSGVSIENKNIKNTKNVNIDERKILDFVLNGNKQNKLNK